MLRTALCALQLLAGDTLRVQPLGRPPARGAAIDSTHLGRPQLRLPTGQGTAFVWLLRARDTIFIAASIPDSTPYWGDDFVVSLDVGGGPASSPGHGDFQWYVRRMLDSSVVYRGRNGRWEPPRGDPDWRLGSEHREAGWEVSGLDGADRWSVLLRLDPGWLAGSAGQPPRVAFRIYDQSPQGWFTWPRPQGSAPPTTVEDKPALWAPIGPM